MTMSRDELKQFAKDEIAKVRTQSQSVIKRMRRQVDPELAEAVGKLERQAKRLADRIRPLPAMNLKATVAAMAVAGSAFAAVGANADEVRLRVENATLVDKAVTVTECVRDPRLQGIAKDRVGRNWFGRIIGAGAGVAAANLAGGNEATRIVSGAVGAILGDKMQEDGRKRRLAEQDHAIGHDPSPCPPGEKAVARTYTEPATLVRFTYDGQPYEVVKRGTNIAIGDVVSVDTVHFPAPRAVAQSRPKGNGGPTYR